MPDGRAVYLPAKMQLSHPPGKIKSSTAWCIYLPKCSFHTCKKVHSGKSAGVFTCQNAAFTPVYGGSKQGLPVYLPAKMQLSHHDYFCKVEHFGCIYLPICSFHTKLKPLKTELTGVFTCQYAAFTPGKLIRLALLRVYLPANMQLSHQCTDQNLRVRRVYLPANMQLSHLPKSCCCPLSWCIYLPICSFHTRIKPRSYTCVGVFTCQNAAFTPSGAMMPDGRAVYLPAKMQLSHPPGKIKSSTAWCIYLPKCSFHTCKKVHSGKSAGVFTCQNAAFTPVYGGSKQGLPVYLPAKMQLSHHDYFCKVEHFGCIYLPICSFHTKLKPLKTELTGVFTCQYAAFTPGKLIRLALLRVYLPANMQLSHQCTDQNLRVRRVYLPANMQLSHPL